MISNPPVDGHSDRGDTRMTKEDTGQVGSNGAAQLKIVKDTEDGLMEPFQIARERQPKALKRHGQIGRKLTGKMKYAPSSPVDPLSADPQSTEAIIVGDDVSPAARSPHTDGWRVLAEQQGGTASIPQFVDDPALEHLDFLKVN